MDNALKVSSSLWRNHISNISCFACHDCI